MTTREEVLAMAKQAGFGNYEILLFQDQISAVISLAFAAGRAAEREECAKDKVDAVCEWTQDDEGGYWETQCGEAFEIIDGTPEQNGMKYCHHCGKTLSARSAK